MGGVGREGVHCPSQEDGGMDGRWIMGGGGREGGRGG